MNLLVLCYDFLLDTLKKLIYQIYQIYKCYVKHENILHDEYC